MPVPKNQPIEQIRTSSGERPEPVQPKRPVKVVKVHREDPQFLEKALEKKREEES